MSQLIKVIQMNPQEFARYVRVNGYVQNHHYPVYMFWNPSTEIYLHPIHQSNGLFKVEVYKGKCPCEGN